MMGEKKELLGEQIEKAGVSFIRSGGRIPGRVEAGLRIQQKIDSLMDSMFSQIQWGIVTAIKGEFVIPDYISLAGFAGRPGVPEDLLHRWTG
jgi:hypothetical protein